MKGIEFGQKEAQRALDDVIAAWERTLEDLQAARLAVNGDITGEDGDASSAAMTLVMMANQSFRTLGTEAANRVGVSARIMAHAFDALANGDASVPMMVDSDLLPEELRRMFEAPDAKRDFDGGTE